MIKKWFASVLFVGLLSASALAASGGVSALTSKSFENLDKSAIAVVMFTADYCGPCKALKREVLLDLSAEYANDLKVRFFTLDVQADQPASDGTLLQDNWAVRNLPYLVIVKNGAVVYTRMGYTSGSQESYKAEVKGKIASLK